MNTITAVLCKKPVIGIAMWLMTLCATNQALNDKYVDLSASGVLLVENFNAPMDEQYTLMLLLRRTESTPEAYVRDWRNLLCISSSADGDAIMPLNFSIRITDSSGKSNLIQSFQPSCQRPNHEEPSILVLGALQVKKGGYRAELVNNTPLAILAGKRVQVLLMGESAGYP